MKELASKLDQAAAESEFSGVVSVFRGATSLYSKAFGYRDVKNKLPNTIGTLFGIASGTKVFTALGIGVLVDRGVLSLDTTVGEIDGEYTDFIDEQATILHLLTHTSGIYDYYDEEIEHDFDHFAVEIPWCELETPVDYYPLFEGQAMKFRAGERYSYSNGGYVFLGMLIERLAGMRYRDFIRQQVLEPAGMRRSGFYAFNDLPENTANGHLEDRRTTNIYQLPLRGGGDGGMFTTPDDLRAFWDSLFSHQIISEELAEIYLDTHWSFDDTRGYGCGIYKRLDDRVFWISGGDAGVGFASWHVPKEKLTITIFSNITNGEGAIRKVVLSVL